MPKIAAARSTTWSRVDGGALSIQRRTAGDGCPFQRLPVLDMIEVSDRTSSGCSAASTWPIIPPIDAPTMWAGAMSRPSIRAAASSAMSERVYWPGGVRLSSISLVDGGLFSTWVERPMSRLSKRTTRKPSPASRSQKSSCQAIIWVASPMTSSKGGSAGVAELLVAEGDPPADVHELLAA